MTESVTAAPSTPTTPGSDVAGRTYDVGTISTVKDVAGELVLQLDRWTVKGVSDGELAKDGMSVVPHTDSRFTNQNNDRLRTVPVAPGATLVVNQCVKTGDQLGLRSTPQDAAGWLEHADRSAVLLLTYDDRRRSSRWTPTRAARAEHLNDEHPHNGHSSPSPSAGPTRQRTIQRPSASQSLGTGGAGRGGPARPAGRRRRAGEVAHGGRHRALVECT